MIRDELLTKTGDKNFAPQIAALGYGMMDLTGRSPCCKVSTMMIELKPETEQLVQEEIRRGHFHSVDELIVQTVYAWREKHDMHPTTAAPAREPRKNLADFLLESPFHGSELQIERQKDYPREIDLS